MEVTDIMRAHMLMEQMVYLIAITIVIMGVAISVEIVKMALRARGVKGA